MDRNDAIVRLVGRVELGRGSFRVLINLGALLEGAPKEIILARESAVTIKRRGVEMRLVLESSTAQEAKVDQVLLNEDARAHRCFEALLSGRAASVEGIAASEHVDARYVSNLLPLAFLSPDIVEAIIRGTQPADLTTKKLIRRIYLPLEWRAQKQVLGFR
jgi:site-specific DNA recombinase